MDKRHNFKTGYPKIRELLMREWDPIGVQCAEGAEDEYDGYIPLLFAMVVVRNATIEEIGRHLLDIETDNMGLRGGELVQERCLRVAKALIELRPALIQ